MKAEDKNAVLNGLTRFNASGRRVISGSIQTDLKLRFSLTFVAAFLPLRSSVPFECVVVCVLRKRPRLFSAERKNARKPSPLNLQLSQTLRRIRYSPIPFSLATPLKTLRSNANGLISAQRFCCSMVYRQNPGR